MRGATGNAGTAPWERPGSASGGVAAGAGEASILQTGASANLGEAVQGAGTECVCVSPPRALLCPSGELGWFSHLRVELAAPGAGRGAGGVRGASLRWVVSVYSRCCERAQRPPLNSPLSPGEMAQWLQGQRLILGLLADQEPAQPALEASRRRRETNPARRCCLYGCTLQDLLLMCPH